MSTAEHTAEGTYKLAEIAALEAEQEAQNLRKRSEHAEQYGSMADAYILRAQADTADGVARIYEDLARDAYKAWADMVSWA